MLQTHQLKQSRPSLTYLQLQYIYLKTSLKQQSRWSTLINKTRMTLQVLLIMLPMSIYLSIKMISSCGSVSLKARCSSLASRSSGRKDRFVPRWTVNTLSGCHCTNMVLSIWRQSFPQVVHNSIANLDINANTFARGVCFFKRLALGLSNSRPSER